MSNESHVGVVDLYPYIFRSIDEKYNGAVRIRDKTGWDEIFEPTYTSIEHSNRLIIEWSINSFSLFASFLLCLFLWSNKKLMFEYSHSITFITFASHFLYWPFYIFATWQTINLLFEHVPYYSSVLSCTILRHIVISTFHSATLVIFPVSINQIVLLFRKKPLNFETLVAIQICLTFFELFFVLGHIIEGNITMNDICSRFISSYYVFAVSMIVNHSILMFSLIVNIISLIMEKLRLSKTLKKSWIILIMSITHIFFQTPLSIRQYRVLLSRFAGQLEQSNFKKNMGYMITFSCVFITPLISMLLIRKFRRAFLHLSSQSSPSTSSSNSSLQK
ncbi:unnamed protein product [Caenorhabditis angaria]|uniref:Uncharacterized protein n=1 Tax=Caenorhabditis angaria TaxID=860376 RepID=A0A9P1IWR8_9PELO|nr:unnamed protein product [Caenorhabditis angaria]